MVSLNVKKAMRLIILSGAACLAGFAQANTVNLTISNSTSEPLTLVSGSPYGSLPATIPANSSQSVTLTFSGTRSDIEATYRRVGTGTTCTFKASHVVQTSGPVFNKSATPEGTPTATCSATQSPRYTSPYNYSATFYYNF